MSSLIRDIVVRRAEPSLKYMKCPNPNDIATGSLAGTIGFFSRMRNIPWYSADIFGLGFSVFAFCIMFTHPYFKMDDQNHIVMAISLIAIHCIGWALEYGLGVEEYVTNPFLLALAFLSVAIAKKFDTEAQLNINEIRALLRIAVDIAAPGSRLRRLTLGTV